MREVVAVDDGCLVWRRLSKLHEEKRSQVLWAMGFNEAILDAVCRLALQIGFVSAAKLDGFIHLRPNRKTPRMTTPVSSVYLDAVIVAKVEEHLQQSLLEFTRGDDCYVDICLSWYLLPAMTIVEICYRLTQQLSLQANMLNATTLRICRKYPPTPSLQLSQFPGAIIYIGDATAAQYFCNVLRRSAIDALGMDTEWKPERPGDNHPTALIQFCFKTTPEMRRGCAALPLARGSDYVCFLLHLAHFGMTPAIAAILKDQAIAKIGVEIDGDISRLNKHFNVHVRSEIELHDRVWEKRRIFVRGLRQLFNATIGCDYPKNKDITLSNWDIAPLTHQQQNYAACDAFAALRIYECLTRGF